MTCKEFSSMIPAFMADTLDDNSLLNFLDHLDECKGCREELEIQYLVSKVFDQTDPDEEVNLSRDLPAFIDKEQKLLHKRQWLSIIAAVCESAAIATFVVTVVVYMML